MTNHYENLLTYLGINTFTQHNDEFLCNCIFCGDVKKNLQVNFIKKFFIVGLAMRVVHYLN